MKQEQIERINELARKSKTTGLTPEEKEEQKREEREKRFLGASPRKEAERGF